MTPSNPANGNANIMDIMASDDLKHQVAPVAHTHEKIEVTGLVADINSLGMSLAAKMSKVANASAGNFPKLKADGELEDSGKSASDFMPATTVDSAPTENSTNLVTSGGVKTALDGKANASHTHTVSQITDFNSSVNAKVLSGVEDAIRGVSVTPVEVSSNNAYDMDGMLEIKNRQRILLVTNTDVQSDSISKYFTSTEGKTIQFDDDTRKLDNDKTYLISIIYVENETTYSNGRYFVSVLSEF